MTNHRANNTREQTRRTQETTQVPQRPEPRIQPPRRLPRHLEQQPRRRAFTRSKVRAQACDLRRPPDVRHSRHRAPNFREVRMNAAHESSEGQRPVPIRQRWCRPRSAAKHLSRNHRLSFAIRKHCFELTKLAVLTTLYTYTKLFEGKESFGSAAERSQQAASVNIHARDTRKQQQAGAAARSSTQQHAAARSSSDITHATSSSRGACRRCRAAAEALARRRLG